MQGSATSIFAFTTSNAIDSPSPLTHAKFTFSCFPQQTKRENMNLQDGLQKEMTSGTNLYKMIDNFIGRFDLD